VAFTYEPATPLGQVRLLIPDREPTAALFADEEIAAFLSMEGDNVRRAAALALETAASNAALVDRVVSIQQVSGTVTMNGAQVATALRARASDLRTLADRADSESDAGAAIDWAEQSLEPFGARNRLLNQRRRGVI
jgi:hypothetical protein